MKYYLGQCKARVAAIVLIYQFLTILGLQYPCTKIEQGIAVGTRPDQPLSFYHAGELKTVFNALSINGDALPKLKKAQLETVDLENREAQALMSDSANGDGYSVKLGINGKNYKEDIKGKIEKRKWQNFVNYLLLRQAIERALEQVQEIIDFHHAQMETLTELIRESRSKLAVLDEQKQALTKELKHFRETGRLDLDDSGKFKDERAEEALATWEEWSGSHIDLRNSSSYLGVMKAVGGIEIQETEIKAGIEKDEKDYEYHRIKRGEAIQIQIDLESGDPERCEKALERLEKIEGEQSLIHSGSLITEDSTIENSQKQQISNHMELTRKDMSQDGFSFNFPPLQSNFTDAVQKAGNNLATKEAEKLASKPIQLGPAIK